MINIIAIGLGGALGAIFRYLLGNQISIAFGTNFPFSILIINVIGSFFMGMAIESFNLFSISNEPLQKFFTVGILGAITTFSTFSLDAVDLILKNRFSDAFIYVFASVSYTHLTLPTNREE